MEEKKEKEKRLQKVIDSTLSKKWSLSSRYYSNWLEDVSSSNSCMPLACTACILGLIIKVSHKKDNNVFPQEHKVIFLGHTAASFFKWSFSVNCFHFKKFGTDLKTCWSSACWKNERTIERKETWYKPAQMHRMWYNSYLRSRPLLHMPACTLEGEQGKPHWKKTILCRGQLIQLYLLQPDHTGYG